MGDYDHIGKGFVGLIDLAGTLAGCLLLTLGGSALVIAGLVAYIVWGK